MSIVGQINVGLIVEKVLYFNKYETIRVDANQYFHTYVVVIRNLIQL